MSSAIGCHHYHDIHESESFGIPLLCVDEAVDICAVCLAVFDYIFKQLSSENFIVVIHKFWQQLYGACSLRLVASVVWSLAFGGRSCVGAADCFEHKGAHDCQIIVPEYRLRFEGFGKFVGGN